MSDFKSINGYSVKDEYARNRIEEVSESTNIAINNLGEQLTESANQSNAGLQNQINQIGESMRQMDNEIIQNTEAVEQISEDFTEHEVSQKRVTLLMFGAVGDGTTNNDEAFSRAIAYCKENRAALYIPGGTYIVSNPVVVPGGFSLIGESKNSTVIKLANGANCNVIESENFGALATGESNNMPNNIHIEHMTIDGNRANNTYGNGIAIFASEPFLSDLIVKECAENGIYSNANVSYILPKQGIEGTFKDIYVKFTGKNCILFLGPNDSYFENVKCVNGSQLEDNVYCNFYAENITFRMNHYHGWNFHDDYGYKRTRYCMALVNCESVECTTSHFEGGRTGCVLLEGSIGTKIVNSAIYASFGLWNIAVKGNYNMFSGCTYVGAAPDSSVNFYSCVVYLAGSENRHNRFEGLCTADANFVDEMNSNGNYYNITSYSSKQFALNPAFDKSIFILQNDQIETATNRKLSFPHAVNAPINIARQVNDLELTSQYWIPYGVDVVTVKVAIANTSVQLPPTVNGSNIYIGNGSDVNLVIECAGHTINGKDFFTLEPNTMKHFVGDNSGNYWC